MKALKLVSKGKAEILDVPKPLLRPDYILLRVIAVALNPTDWKHIDEKNHEAIPTIGCDCAGIVEEIGSAVRRPFAKGDRVCAFLHGSNKVQPEDGAFAQYAVAKGDIAMIIPNSMTFEEASTLGVGLITVGQGLYQTLKLPWPTTKPADHPQNRQTVLVYGGSSATGALAIQFLKLSGLEVVATCSPQSREYVLSLGADAIFDYHLPECGSLIRSHTQNKLFYAWDTIGTASTRAICAAALSSDPEIHDLYYGAITPVREFPRWDVEAFSTLAYTVQGEAFEIGARRWEGEEAHFEFGQRWTQAAVEMIELGKVKPHRAEVRTGGIEGIVYGLDELRKGEVRCKKLVYLIVGES